MENQVTTDGGRAVGEQETDRLRLAALLTREELPERLTFCNECLLHEREEQLHGAMVALGDRLGFEFVLFTHMASTYAEGQPISRRNLSNPVPWMEEYTNHGYLAHDPVRRELEIRLKRGEMQGAFVWDQKRPRTSVVRQNYAVH